VLVEHKHHLGLHCTRSKLLFGSNTSLLIVGQKPFPIYKRGALTKAGLLTSDLGGPLVAKPSNEEKNKYQTFYLLKTLSIDTQKQDGVQGWIRKEQALLINQVDT